MSGFVCGPKVYRYKGILFEYHSYFGPWPLNKNYQPRARAGKKFFDLVKEFDKLSERQKERCFLGGGCIRI